MKILILSYYLNPKTNVGAIRPGKFIKYLNQNKHKVFVVSSEKYDIECELLYTKRGSSFDSSSFYQINKKRSLSTKLMFYIKLFVKDILFSPDKHIWWNLRRLPYMIKLVKKQKIDIAFATGSPFSTFVALYFLKLICSIPIVIDFRDPWKNCITIKKQSYFRRLTVKLWEKHCVLYADGITSVYDWLASQLQEYNPKGKIVTITNGFDPDDFELNFQNDDNRFIFLYTGKYSIYREDYNPIPIFEAFKEFKRLTPNNSILRFIGYTDSATIEYSKKYSEYNIICESAKTKSEIVQSQFQANVFIHFFYPHSNDTISMKIYEYVYQKKIILSFNQRKGILFDFLENNGFGYSASSHNQEEMVSMFKKVYEGELTYSPRTEISQLNKYKYEVLTNKLIQLAYEILKG